LPKRQGTPPVQPSLLLQLRFGFLHDATPFGLLRVESCINTAAEDLSMRALGTVIHWNPDEPLSKNEFHSGLLDYYDWWDEIDPRIAKHHDQLSPPAFAFGHDLVNMATYANEVLSWLPARRMHRSVSVVVVSGMAEAFLFSLRSACDTIASVLSYSACEKPGQAPNSLSRLVEWANKNEHRVHPDVLAVLKSDLDWFWKMRRIRDDVAHGFADVVTLCTGHQFDLLVMSTKTNQNAFREPMIPLLAHHLVSLVDLSNRAADAVNQIIDFPLERRKSRVVSGVLIPALYKLVRVAPNYATPVKY
jgi:hypothetical protein